MHLTPYFTKQYCFQKERKKVLPLKNTKKRENKDMNEWIHRLWTVPPMDIWWLDPEFFTAQKHITIPNRKFCKMYENLALVMQDYGLLIHSDKIWANYYRKYPRIPLNYLGYLKKALIGCPLSISKYQLRILEFCVHIPKNSKWSQIKEVQLQSIRIKIFFSSYSRASLVRYPYKC